MRRGLILPNSIPLNAPVNKFRFYGSFADKAKASAKAATVDDSYVKPAMVKGKQRWLVLTAPRRQN
jgi:hypothetical protein